VFLALVEKGSFMDPELIIPDPSFPEVPDLVLFVCKCTILHQNQTNFAKTKFRSSLLDPDPAIRSEFLRTKFTTVKKQYWYLYTGTRKNRRFWLLLRGKRRGGMGCDTRSCRAWEITRHHFSSRYWRPENVAWPTETEKKRTLQQNYKLVLACFNAHEMQRH
jgi:hypothetical protein